MLSRWGLLVFVFFVHEMVAQPLYNDSLLSGFQLNSEMNYGSNFISNKVFRSVFFDGKLKLEDTKEAVEKIDNSGRIGADVMNGFLYRFNASSFLGRANTFLSFGFTQTNHLSVVGSKDLWNLVLTGNESLRGHEVKNTHFQLRSYHFIEGWLGYEFYYSKKQQKIFSGIQLSILRGQQGMQMYTSDDTFFTEETGQSIRYDGEANLKYTNRGRTGLTSYNGWGLLTDLYTEFLIDSTSKFRVDIQDVGFVQWIDDAREVIAPEDFYFDGYEIQDIFTDTLTGNIFTLDSITKQKTFITYVPVKLQGIYSKEIGEDNIQIGVFANLIKAHSPLFFVNYAKKFKSLSVVSHLSYGGYSNVQFGLAMEKYFGKKMRVQLGTRNLEGIVLPEIGSAYSSYINIHYIIN